MLRNTWGEGVVKFLHIERKITSVVHSHPPSHYIRKHAPRWQRLVMFTTRRMQPKIECFRFHAATLHCAHAKHNFIELLSYEIERLSFLGWYIVFQHLGRFNFTTSKSPTSILWYAAFDISTFWCGETCVLKNCESRNITLPFLTRATCVLSGIENQKTQHCLSLQCSSVNISLPCWLGHDEWKFATSVNVRSPFCEARFPGKKFGVMERLASSHVNSHSLVKPSHILTWENTRKVNPTIAAGFLRIFFEKRFPVTFKARRALLDSEKTKNQEGLLRPSFSWKKRNLGAVGRMSYTLTVTVNARRILPEENTRICGVGTTRSDVRNETIGLRLEASARSPKAFAYWRLTLLQPCCGGSDFDKLASGHKGCICIYACTVQKKMIVRHPVAMFSIVFLIFESTLFFHHGRGRNVCFLQFSPKDRILKKQDIENRETILAFSIDIWLQFSCPQVLRKISIFCHQNIDIQWPSFESQNQ